MKSTVLAAAAAALAMTLAASASADPWVDPDVEFSRQLQGYGIYGPRDYNAWLGKIVCERLNWGKDPDAQASVRFIGPNLPRDSTQAQSWQFLGASINSYCPNQRPVYERAAGQ